MTKQPEDPQSARIPQLFHGSGYAGDGVLTGKMLKQFLCVRTVVVG
jgi:hypothetical protein